MIVLGFDTATQATAVGLRLADGSTLQALDDPPAGEHPGHATRLLPLASGLLADAHLRWSDLGRIAVGVGPGTFTGLRIGVATARGLAQSLSLSLTGISSLRALAYAAGGHPAHHAPGGRRRLEGVLAVIDARRGEVFLGAYRDGGELLAPRTSTPEGLVSVVERLGPDAQPGRWLAVGDGAVRFRGHLEALGLRVPPEDSLLHRVSGAVICALGAGSTGADAQEVVPDYCRRPDAEIALEGALR